MSGELPPGSRTAPYTVLVGPGRSGSTLVDLLAGDCGVVTLGEMCHFLERVVLEDQLCGCGVPFSTCDFWGPIRLEVMDEFGQAILQRAELERRRAESWMRFPYHLLTGGRRVPPAYSDVLCSALNAVYRKTGDIAVLDSSKSPIHALFVADLGFATRIVGVSRECGGVVFSWMNAKPRPEADQLPMPSHGFWGACLRWIYGTFASILVAPSAIDYAHLCGSPNDVIEIHELKVDGGSEWKHGIGGNPVRFNSGTKEIRLDRRYVDGLSARQLQVCRSFDRAAGVARQWLHGIASPLR